MTKLEKVIKGLEACIKHDCRENACTYGNMSHGCMTALHSDALELLKEQRDCNDVLREILSDQERQMQKLNLILEWVDSTTSALRGSTIPKWYMPEPPKEEEDA